MKKKTSRHLVIGLGEVGRALKEVLGAAYVVDGLDLNLPPPVGLYDAIHVCIPFSSSFTRSVKAYIKKYQRPGGLIVIHSTVALGTSAKLGAVHSPVRGIHPHLVSGIRTFVKYFGGPRATEAAKIFSALGIKTQTTSKSATTEALKLWDTTMFGWNILLEKAVAEYCRRHALDFDIVYRQANQSYNAGYAALGRPEFTKYVLRHIPGPVGGHCVMSNCDLLDSEVARVIKKWNKERKYLL